MKHYNILILLLVLFISSCEKSTKSTSPTTPSNNSFHNITNNYKGGTLSWTKYNQSGQSSNGTDPNATFYITANANSISVNISTIAPISPKSYTINLKSKAEGTYQKVYTYETINNSVTTSANINLFPINSTDSYALIEYTNSNPQNGLSLTLYGYIK